MERVPRTLPLRLDEVGVWVLGVALCLLLGLTSATPHTWAAAVMVVAVAAVGAYYVRVLGLEAGVVVLLIVTNIADHFTFRLGSYDVRAEQVAAVAGLVALGATRVRIDGLRTFKPNAAEWLLGAWLTWSAVSSVVGSPDKRLSAKILVLIAVCTLGFLLPRRLLAGSRSRENLEIVLRWLLIAFATESLYGSFAYLLHAFGPTISIGPNPASGHLEAYGTLWEQNVFGAFAAAGGVAWVYLGRQRFERAWIGLALCMSGLVDSLTRAAWLAASAVGLLGLAVPSLRKRIDFLMVGTGLLGGLLSAAAVLIVETLGNYVVPVPGATHTTHHGLFSAIFNMTDFIGRLNQWGVVSGDIRGRFAVLGRGTASFEALHVSGGVPQHIASLPLLVLNDTGIVGFLIFAAFVAAVAYRAWTRRSDDVVVGLSQMMIVVGLANLATQTTELMIGWLMLGLLVAAADIAPAAAARSQAARSESRAA